MIVSDEEDLPDDPFFSKHIDLIQNDWFNHIHKLCSESVISIYMKEDANSPLIMTTCIGHQGTAVHSVPDATSGV
jgi:hypothetical protein